MTLDQAILIAQRTAKPIHEGGTGATDADMARLNLEAQKCFRKVTTPWTPGTLANANAATTTVTVPQVALGDTAVASFSLALPAGVFLVASVAAAGSVLVTLINLSGSSQTISAGTLRVDTF